MTHAINSNPLEFEGLRKNKQRPPLTMEPSIDDPLAAVKSIMRYAYFSVNDSTKIGGAAL